MGMDKIIQNIKTITIMKSCGYTDREIADYVGMGVREFLEKVNGDEYLKEVYEKAGEKMASEIERGFLELVMRDLEEGKGENARFVLERTNRKYAKKEQVDVTIKTIDEIIRENEKE
jgi:transcription elongation factor GreA-like protein